MASLAREYPDYRWRRKWRLGNWYVALILAASVCTLVGGSVLYAYERMPKEVFVGTLVFPILILAFAGLFAAVNKARLTLDRWKGSEDGVDWPVETPIESFWIQRQAIGFGWRILFISTFYIYSSGFGWVGGALRRSFVPWKHVRNIEHRTFSGVIEYTRAGNDRHLKLASVKPILDAWELAKQPGSRKRI